MAHWLVKTEPETYSIDQLARDKKTLWDNVRNYQARNFLVAMAPDDQVLVYHSSADAIGVVGLAKVAEKAQPDPSQFDQKSDYFDPKATKAEPRWFAPMLRFEKKFKEIIPLPHLKKVKGLEKMTLLQRGSRLSVQPVSEREFEIILGLADK